ncbi:MAG: L,D-transpeptidase [Anaerolineaceae bacterium]|jgi:hypothetical protein
MKTKLIGLFGIIAILGLASFFQPVQAATQPNMGEDLPLCLPGIYPVDPGDCLPLGPSETLKELKMAGINPSTLPLPAFVPDADLSELPVHIARIDSSGPVPVYANLDAAINGGEALRVLAAGPMRYVTVVNRYTGGGRSLVQMDTGEWVEANPIYSWNRFQGLEFTRTPTTDFGWAVNPAISYQKPGFDQVMTGKEYPKYHLFQIYQVQTVGDYEWYRIGPDEWVNSLKARRVHPDPTPPEGVTGDRWIAINLDDQVLTAYEKGRLKFASLITTGIEPFYTQPGTFQIYQRYDTVTMQDAYEADRSDFYHLQGVPWVQFYDRNIAIHGIYWPVMLGFPQSHGCVNMTPGDANWLYHWAKEGDWVHVWDPSGKTPLDSPLYGGSNRE